MYAAVQPAPQAGGARASGGAGQVMALARADADDLLAAAIVFERSDLLLLAAGAAAQAAVLHRRGGRLAQAAAAAALSRRYEKSQVSAPGAAACSLPISAREREVGCLVAAGLSNREIAARLRVSVRTVEGHIYRACMRLGVPDRGGLAALVGAAPTSVEVGVLALGSGSVRRLRRAREAAVEARLPIEVSRLRLELRGALDDVRASRARVAIVGERERRRLERDLHDGAQQQVVAVGMRLRSVQRGLDPGGGAHAELDRVVEALEVIVAELRRLAHGVRPARLDDGLAAALRDLVRDSALPVELAVTDVAVPDLVATTVYYVVAEALTNTLKHAQAQRVTVVVERVGPVLRVCVRDDGVGGATDGFGWTSLHDRVASAGGELTLHSPVGAGTELRVELPCGS